jgi:hypothetical protein
MPNGPCTCVGAGEQAGFTPTGVGYSDFNLYMLAANVSATV